MAWRIEEKRGQRKLFPENKRRNEGIVTFTSKTRVGLYEEIDRFIMEKKPATLKAESRGLVPEYEFPFEGESRWSHTMKAEGMVKD